MRKIGTNIQEKVFYAFIISLPLYRILSLNLGIVNLSLSELFLIFGFLGTLKDDKFYHYLFSTHRKLIFAALTFILFIILSFIQISKVDIGLRYLFSTAMKFMEFIFVSHVIFNFWNKTSYLKTYAIVLFFVSILALLQISVTQGAYEGNITGTFAYRNEFLFYLVPGTLLSLYFYLKEGNKKYLFLYLIMLSTIILSRGRAGSFITVALSLAFVVVRYKTKIGTIFVTIFGVLIVGFGLILILPSTITDELFYRYFEAFSLEQEGETGSSFIRYILLTNGFDKFLESPFIGYGAGDFFSVSSQFQQLKAFGFDYLQPHNSYLGILVELGGVGLLSFLIIIGQAFRRVNVKKLAIREQMKFEYNAYKIILIAILINLASFDGSLRECLWFFLPFAIIRNSSRRLLGDNIY